MSVLALVAAIGFGARHIGPPQQEAPASVQLWIAKDVAPSSKIQVQLNTRNVPVVTLTARKIDGWAWLSQPHRDREPEPKGKTMMVWRTAVETVETDSRIRDRYFSRAINLPKLPPGVYAIEAVGKGHASWGVVDVTNFAAVVKRSPKHVLVWVTAFDSKRVIRNAEISLFDSYGHKLTQATTNEDGVALFSSKPGGGPLLIQKGPDLAGIATSGIDPDGRLEALFQTDRPIYRPGQKVSFKAILRLTHGQGYDLIPDEDVRVELRDAKDNPIDEMTVRPSKMGSVSGEFSLPAEGMVGPYTLSLWVRKQQALQTITVAEYRKPEFKVDVAPAQPRYLAGEDARFLLNSKYYFGAVVPQAEIRWTVRHSPYAFYAPSGDDAWSYGGDGNLYPSDTYSAQPFVAQGTSYTDNEGKAAIPIKTDPNAGDATYTISATVIDSSRRQVTAGASVPVYAAQLRLGLSSELQFASQGAKIPVMIRAVDLDGRPSGANVKLRIFKSVWVEKDQRLIWKEVGTLTVNVPGSGLAHVGVPAKAEGELRIEATADDGTGRKAKAELEIWVAESTVPPNVKMPTLTTRVDRRSYSPGEVVNASIATSSLGLPILVAVEGQDVWFYKVFKKGKAQQAYSFKTSCGFSPTAYVTAATWTKGGLLQSNVMVPVPDLAKLLKVRIEPDKAEYRPGDRATMTVRTLDGTGKPVAAEVALSVVDEAIYALSPDTTPDPYRFYWGQRSNWVESFASAPEEVSGGAYQMANPAAPVRSRFEDTAFWNAVVITDKEGNGQATFEMPGNLTSWRATARGVDGSTRVGKGLTNVVATRPLTLRLATPRRLVVGDHLTLIGTINSRAKIDIDCRVSLRAEGLQIADASAKTVTVNGASGQATVSWDLVVDRYPTSGFVSLRGDVVPVDRSKADRDAIDALQMTVPVVPKGVRGSVLAGGALASSAEAAVDVPNEALSEGITVRVDVRSGVKPAQVAAAEAVIRGGRYGTLAAANQLVAAITLGLAKSSEPVREAFALLSRTESPSGWGWWDGLPPDPTITARVTEALALAKQAGIPVYEPMMNVAISATERLYEQTNLWEHKALMASALTMAEVATKVGKGKGLEWLAEVMARGEHLSPFARLKMAEALSTAGQLVRASTVFQVALERASVSDADAYFPTGEGIGWTANSLETTAQGLTALMRLNWRPDLQQKLARWLVSPERDQWPSMDDEAAVARALHAYLKVHPDPLKLGPVSIWFNAQKLETQAVRVADSVFATVPAGLAHPGRNTVKLERIAPGEAAFVVRAGYFLPRFNESARGIRVARRFERRDEAGVWREVNGPVKPGEPIRCTVLAWGDDLSDALKIEEPIPAGFEFVSSEGAYWAREEVRDAAVIHYATNGGSPLTFRYYLRSESSGRVHALPVHAEYLRRPATDGQSGLEVFEVLP